MKKTKFFSLIAATLAVGFVACNNEGDGTASGDTALNNDTANTATTTTTTTTDYSALADTFRTNSEAGNYLDPRTGKALRINVDPQTGSRTNAETGEPVWRYVDKRTWWVYSGDDTDMEWDTVGQARMEGSRIMYRGDNDTWTTYDKRWKTEDETKMKSWKTKVGDTKIKVSKDGDIKVKDESGKVKYDADDNKIKTDSSD